MLGGEPGNEARQVLGEQISTGVGLLTACSLYLCKLLITNVYNYYSTVVVCNDFHFNAPLVVEIYCISLRIQTYKYVYVYLQTDSV